MATSTYAYCYKSCPVDFIIKNKQRLGLHAFGGVVGVDHYWTKQGMPCVGGKPQEFAMQKALSDEWHSEFPTMRFMTYRILSAVPYDMAVQNKIISDPDFFVRWKHMPGST